MLNYFVLHFIGMYMPYLAACEPQITQRESPVKDRENKNTDKNVPEIGIIWREIEAGLEIKEAARHDGGLQHRCLVPRPDQPESVGPACPPGPATEVLCDFGQATAPL